MGGAVVLLHLSGYNKRKRKVVSKNTATCCRRKNRSVAHIKYHYPEQIKVSLMKLINWVLVDWFI
jgi:hypothetical protein